MTIKKYTCTIYLVLAVMITACTNSLDQNPLDQISSSNFWKSK